MPISSCLGYIDPIFKSFKHALHLRDFPTPVISKLKKQIPETSNSPNIILLINVSVSFLNNLMCPGVSKDNNIGLRVTVTPSRSENHENEI